ncbi:MAG TPA: FAD-binding oxidoreductase [Candidatus Angelobacter sp.]|nr:FAD-binding oxidoreductase [Candidatus Angelobacter sp.]
MSMIHQNWWFTTLLVKQFKHCPPLNKAIKCDVLIVGGGVSGVSAAAEFLKQGRSVVMLERNLVGGGSSGRSAGFLTPDSELELHQLVRRFGHKAAREIWDAPLLGIERIVNGVKQFDIQCGLVPQDSLFLGIGKSGKAAVESELECRKSVGFNDQQAYDEETLRGIIGAVGYSGGIRYGGTYGFNPLLCLQGFKDVFIDHGMEVFESTELERIEDHTAYTRGGSVTAENIIIAVDKLDDSISPLAKEIFHAQTFMSVSAPLTDKELLLLFPGGTQMQCWDSKLVYSYFRLTGDNRLLLGGGSATSTFLREAYNDATIIQRVIKRFKDHFPFLLDLPFIQFWPGLIDTTRDLLPIIVKPPTQPHLQFILGVVGLPWASFAGSFAARNVLGIADADYKKYYQYFSNRRHFVLPAGLGNLIGKPLLFSLTNGWAKFYQVDKHRKPDQMKDEF